MVGREVSRHARRGGRLGIAGPASLVRPDGCVARRQGVCVACLWVAAAAATGEAQSCRPRGIIVSGSEIQAFGDG